MPLIAQTGTGGTGHFALTHRHLLDYNKRVYILKHTTLYYRRFTVKLVKITIRYFQNKALLYSEIPFESAGKLRDQTIERS